MFKRRTLFVIGAGASEEAALPLGSGLALDISKKLDIRFDEWGDRHIGGGDFNLFQDLVRAAPGDATTQQMQVVQKASWLIRDRIHLANSIDDFLDLHRDNELLTLVGKAAVIKCILEAEKRSNLYYETDRATAGIDFPNLHATWFTKFMKMAARGVPARKADTLFENVSFVVFNYDRCIQHFLVHALCRYGIDERESAAICGTVRLLQPYGALAPMATRSNPAGVRFGKVDHVNCASLAHNIRTYTEQIEDKTELAQIRTEVEAAECIIFLGFAIHEQNMLLLSPTKKIDPKPVYATAYGMSDDDAASVENRLPQFSAGRTASVSG